MNLWAKSLGQLAIFAVALFFFSCEEDTIQGYKTNPKFKVSYQEFDLPSTVMVLDSIRTSNYLYGSETNKFLVGQYVDPLFGEVKAGFYTQFYPNNALGLHESSEFDSISLSLAFDFYLYGANSSNSQSVSVYTLFDNLLDANRVDYTNETSLEVSPMPVATKSFSVTPQLFEKYLDEANDTTITLKITLPFGYGKSIFDAIYDWSHGGPDSMLLANSQEFFAKFKGLAIKSDVGDKIVRFNPGSLGSAVNLHYHTSTDTLVYTLSFTNQVSFNQITYERSGTELASVTQKYAEYLQNEPLRYIQSGSGLVTKVDLQPFLDFASTQGTMVINSAEIVIDEVVASGFSPPAGLALRAFDPAINRLMKYSANDPKDLTDISSYRGYFLPDFQSNFTNGNIQVERDSVFYVVNDGGGSSAFIYDESGQRYNGYITSFCQQLLYDDGRVQPRYFVLYPTSPSAAKSVNRVVFPQDKLKLRIYYTTPLE